MDGVVLSIGLFVLWGLRKKEYLSVVGLHRKPNEKKRDVLC